MTATPRWEWCVNHRGRDAEDFVQRYFAGGDRRVGLIAGAGFDPRSARTTEMLQAVAPGRVSALFLRQDRPAPHAALLGSAEENVRRLTAPRPGRHGRVVRCL